MRTEDIQIIDSLKKARNIFITCAESHSGDALGSALALYLFLQKAGKKASLCKANFVKTKTLAFLPGIADVRTEIKTGKTFVISLATHEVGAKEITYRRTEGKLEFFITPDSGLNFRPEHISSRTTGHDYDLIVTVGTPDLESLGAVYHHNTDFFFSVPIINIDHHPDNEAYGHINSINITALATAEIIFAILKEYSVQHIDAAVATCLLTGIIAESKSFRVGSLTPHSLVAASELVRYGAERDLIVRNLYQNRDLETLKLWGRALANIRHDLNGAIIWSSLHRTDFAKTGGERAALEDVIEELIVNVPAARVVALFCENILSEGARAAICTTKNINAADIVKELGGRGDKRHAWLESPKPVAELETQVIGHLKRKLEKLPV